MVERFLLTELLNIDTLALRVVVPGRSPVRVRSAHASDLEYPGRYLEEGSALLTYGPTFTGRENDSAYANAYLTDLEAARVPALMFGLGPDHPHLPPALESVAQQRAFPLYEVGAATPFYRIENIINEARLSPESYPLKRSLRITNQLLESMSTEHPLQSLIETLGWSCRGTAALYEESGAIIEATGEGPTRLIFSEVMAKSHAHIHDGRRLTIGRWVVMARSVVVQGQACTLALATRSESVLDDIGEVLLDTAQRLLAAMTGINQAALVQEQHENNQLLTALQDGVMPAREQRYWERMKLFRFEAYRPVRLVWASPVAREAEPTVAASEIISALRAKARLTGIGLLLIEDVAADMSPRLVCVVSEVAALDAWLVALAATHVVGVSEPIATLVSVPQAVHEAQTAWQIARQRRRTADLVGDLGRGDEGVSRANLVRLDDVNLSTWLLARAEAQPLARRSERLVAELRENEALWETLVAYLAFDQDIAACAAHVFLHPNTVRYRLRRCEDLLGGSLTDVAVLCDAYLALFDEVAKERARVGAV